RADAIHKRAWELAHTRLPATVSDQGDTPDAISWNNTLLRTDLSSHITRDDRALREANDDELRGRALIVSVDQFLIHLRGAFIARIVIGHLILRIDVAELRGVRQRPHLDVIRRITLLQWLSD